MDVETRFRKLLDNLLPTEAQKEDGGKKHRGIRACLNAHYYNSNSETANSFLIGSWRKATRIKPPGDVDLYFKLPSSVYYRYEGRDGNRQSQLLQEVRGVLLKRYPATAIKGDGPVVVVPFSAMSIEVVPAFEWESGKYGVCDTQRGGRYKTTDPDADHTHFKEVNDAYQGKLRDLVRLMKRWIYHCDVRLKSYHVELLAADFLKSWSFNDRGYFYYDWMTRDFLAWIPTFAGSFVSAPGTHEAMYIGDAWLSKARTAHDHARNACDLEAAHRPSSALAEWREIFGYVVE